MPVAPGAAPVAGFQHPPFAVPNGMIPPAQIPVSAQASIVILTCTFITYIHYLPVHTLMYILIQVIIFKS